MSLDAVMASSWVGAGIGCHRDTLFHRIDTDGTLDVESVYTDTEASR